MAPEVGFPPRRVNFSPETSKLLKKHQLRLMHFQWLTTIEEVITAVKSDANSYSL